MRCGGKSVVDKERERECDKYVVDKERQSEMNVEVGCCQRMVVYRGD